MQVAEGSRDCKSIREDIVSSLGPVAVAENLKIHKDRRPGSDDRD